MSILKKFQGAIAGSLLSATLFLMPAPSDAMEIKKFNQMSLDDRADYASVLFGEAVKYLWRQGRMEDANQVKALFTKASAEDVSKGMSEFVGVLNGLSDLEQQGKLPQVPHVEQAMFIVFKRHGVTIPMQDLMQFAQDFKPSGGVIGQQQGTTKPSPG